MIIQKSFSFSTAHRLPLHEGVCSNFHGHNYDITVEINTEDLKDYIDSVGYVMDFGKIKKIVNDLFDHKIVLHSKDKYAKDLKTLDLPGLVLVDYPPTVENIATHIASVIKETVENLTSSDAKVTVHLWETKSSYVVRTL